MVMKTLKSFGLGLPWRPLWGGTSKPDAPSSPSFSKNSTASFEESLSAKASTSTTSRASEGDEPSKENLLPRFKMFKHIQLFKRLGKKWRTKQKSCKRKLDEVVYCTSAKKANFTKTKADVFSSKRNSKTDSSKTTIKSTRRFDEESKKSETRSTPTDHDNALTSVTPMLRRDRDLSRDLQEMIASPRCGLQNHLAIQRAQASRNSRAFRLSQRQSLRRNLQNWVAEGPRKAATRCVSIVSRKSLGQSSDFADFRLPCRFSSLLTPDEVSKFRLDDGLMPEGNSQCSPDSPDPWNDRSSKHSFKKAGVPISLDKGPRSTLVDVHDLPDLDFFDDALPPRDKATPFPKLRTKQNSNAARRTFVPNVVNRRASILKKCSHSPEGRRKKSVRISECIEIPSPFENERTASPSDSDYVMLSVVSASAGPKCFKLPTKMESFIDTDGKLNVELVLKDFLAKMGNGNGNGMESGPAPKLPPKGCRV